VPLSTLNTTQLMQAVCFALEILLLLIGGSKPTMKSASNCGKVRTAGALAALPCQPLSQEDPTHGTVDYSVFYSSCGIAANCGCEQKALSCMED